MNGPFSVFLPGFDFVRLADPIPDGLGSMRSWQLVDTTTDGRATPSGRSYMLHVQFEMPDPQRRDAGLTRALDRGITNPTVVATCNDEEITRIECYDTVSAFRENPQWNDETRARLARTQGGGILCSLQCKWNDETHARLARMNRQSNEYRRLFAERGRKNRENANRRDYAEWLLANEICHDARMIIVEKMGFKAMTGRGRRKKWLNRGMRFVRHAEIMRKIRVVAERLGIKVIEVDARNTSVTCYGCGHVDKESRKGEEFCCTVCGHRGHADANASCNIAERGTGRHLPPGDGIALVRRELGRSRKHDPIWVDAAPDAERQRDNTSAKPSCRTDKRPKHLGRYPYVTTVCSGGRSSAYSSI